MWKHSYVIGQIQTAVRSIAELHVTADRQVWALDLRLRGRAFPPRRRSCRRHLIATTTPSPHSPNRADNVQSTDIARLLDALRV